MDVEGPGWNSWGNRGEEEERTISARVRTDIGRLVSFCACRDVGVLSLYDRINRCILGYGNDALLFVLNSKRAGSAEIVRNFAGYCRTRRGSNTFKAERKENGKTRRRCRARLSE